MYYRIKNKLDAKFIMKKIYLEGENFDVANRIVELIEILDGAYGENRKAFDMGGYILFFPDHNTYEKTIVDIWEFYHIEPTGYEYMDYIGDINQNGVKWIEKLFQLSSDDSLVLIYPE